MIKIQPFGPTIGKWKLRDDVFHKLLQITDELIDNKDPETLKKSLSTLNSTLAKAVKKGLIKKQHMARKLSSLSNQLKNIS